MNAGDFLDTNVLLYAYDPADPGKQETAREILRKALGGSAIISTQVLAEFASVLLHKMKPAVPSAHVMAMLEVLRPIRTVIPDASLVKRAVEAHSLYGVRLYDAMIIAAAERASCKRILSEDMNTGQAYFGVVVENPFAP